MLTNKNRQDVSLEIRERERERGSLKRGMDSGEQGPKIEMKTQALQEGGHEIANFASGSKITWGSMTDTVHES